MKKLLVLLVAPAYILVLAGFTCSYHNYGTEEGKASFWKKKDPGVTHYLYIDDTEKGVLPFLPDSLTTPGSDIVQRQGLSMNLKPGRYAIMAKDNSGNILCSGTLLLKRTNSSEEISTSWENGNCSVEVVYNK
jgi:hypothetical protein